jgi:hypothetical protein
MEVCQSGLMGLSRKQSALKKAREFESHRFRQYYIESCESLV